MCGCYCSVVEILSQMISAIKIQMPLHDRRPRLGSQHGRPFDRLRASSEQDLMKNPGVSLSLVSVDDPGQG